MNLKCYKFLMNLNHGKRIFYGNVFKLTPIWIKLEFKDISNKYTQRDSMIALINIEN